jgi:release factor glutamine methyltransferase
VTPKVDWMPLALVREAAGYLARHGVPTPRLDAELLLAHALGSRRIDLYLRFDEPVGEREIDRYRELVRRRATERVSVASLTGEREFWSRPFRVAPETIAPRPETEGVVEAVIGLRPSRVIDAGTGCGAIACAVALELPGCQVLALDRSRAALRVAAENRRALGLEERVWLAQAHWLAPLRAWADVIAANPPYVPTAELEGLAPEVRHEPRSALDGGPDGLDALRAILREAPPLLRRPGAIVLEVGQGQAARVESLLREAGAAGTEVRKDLAGIERVVLGRFGGG